MRHLHRRQERARSPRRCRRCRPNFHLVSKNGWHCPFTRPQLPGLQALGAGLLQQPDLLEVEQREEQVAVGLDHRVRISSHLRCLSSFVVSESRQSWRSTCASSFLSMMALSR